MSKLYRFNYTSSTTSYINSFHHYKHRVSERENKVYNEILDNFIMKYFLDDDADLKLVKEIIYLIFDNFWIQYFLQCDMHGEENWIDFESEISNVVKSIDDKMHGLDKDNNYSLYDKVTDWPNNYLRLFFEVQYGKDITYKVVRDKLERDVDKLIRVFEIYLAEYVEKIDIKIVSPDIEKIAAISNEDREEEGILTNKIISFNYTNIYEKLFLNKYSIASDDYIDYIHGKADINNTIRSNNMVLGIDEYLSDNRKNKDVEFIAFKKFYQRIHKKTGCNYKKWVDGIKKKEYYQHYLYIFGHSLDVTDGDILRDLILNDNVSTTIFYINKDVMGQQIANLVKVIGQDELIRRTGGSTKTIKFVQQKPMEPIVVR